MTYRPINPIRTIYNKIYISIKLKDNNNLNQEDSKIKSLCYIMNLLLYYEIRVFII